MKKRKAKKNTSVSHHTPYIAIVSIVAVIAIVILIMNFSRPSVPAEMVEEGEAIVGEAGRFRLPTARAP